MLTLDDLLELDISLLVDNAMRFCGSKAVSTRNYWLKQPKMEIAAFLLETISIATLAPINRKELMVA